MEGHGARGTSGRLQIRTADANVDDGGQLLSGETLPLATSDLLGELLHVLQDVVDTALGGHDILTVDLHVPATDIAQGGMVNGAVLGEVDLLAGEHSIALLLKAGLLSQLDEKVDGLLGDEVLAEVE